MIKNIVILCFKYSFKLEISINLIRKSKTKL